MAEPEEEFALRTPAGDYLKGEGAAWEVALSSDEAARFTDSHAALEALESARAAGHVVDLYTTDEHGDFSVAVA